MHVDVVIPVYGAREELRACLASVAACTDLTRHRVILVIDDGGDAPLGFHIIRNERRLGFAGSVNRAMRESDRDVVLLNSDTIVTPNWLEKIIDAAQSHERIGTVTPLSNDATLCSVPRAFEKNLLPAGHDANSFAAVIERVSTRERPRIPTAVGFCMFIRRALLDDIGYFDDENFPLGYGEENDFCMRASARGWLHVMDDATFVAHVGHASFGVSRERELRRGAATLRRLHPQYFPLIADFMRRDPAKSVRQRITAALGIDEAHARVVHVVHGWPPFQQAGTELYASWLVRQQRKRGEHVSVYTRGADPSRADRETVEWIDDGVRVRIVTNHFTTRDPLRRNALRDRTLERDFDRFLAQEQPQLVHIHHLAGHTFSLARVARRRGIPIVLQIQDWWFLCARVNQLHRDGTRCSGPAPSKCAACVTLTRVPPASITNRAMHALRRREARAAIASADTIIVGSQAIRDDYVRAGVVPRDTPIHVIPYGIDITPTATPREVARRPIRFGYVGSILPHKGVHTAVEAMRAFAVDDADLHVWGNVDASPEYVATLRDPRVIFEGRFAEEAKPDVFASMDVLLVPSIGLESFGLAPREAMACGVPVIATRGGALSEMEGAQFFDAGDVDGLRAILRRVIDAPTLVAQWRAQLPVPKRSDAHALEIERVYETVLRR